MLTKVWTIAWKELYLTFRDRNLLLIMFVTPLAISTIVGVVFGGLGEDGGGAFTNIPVAIVNQDEGVEQQGETINYGRNLSNFLTGRGGEDSNNTEDDNADCPLAPAQQDTLQGSGITLDELIAASVLDDADEARAAVDEGEYVAAIIIPPDFSAGLSPDFGGDPAEAAVISPAEVYANEGQPISASIVRSVVQGYTNPIKTGNIAIAASIDRLIATNSLASLQLNTNEDAQRIFPCAFNSTLGTVSINQQALTVEDSGLSGIAQLLIQVGAAQAVFFALFSAQFGIISIVDERRAGTLQRMLISPTTRVEILGGKLAGTFVTVIFQVVILMIALTVVASIIDGEAQFIWGSNLIGITAVVIGTALAVCGLGMLVSGLAKTPEQVGAFGSILNILLGVAGGAFGFAFPSPVREFSLIYWGTDGLSQLAQGQTDVLLNIGVLFAMGIVFFGLGLVLFNKRQEI